MAIARLILITVETLRVPRSPLDRAQRGVPGISPYVIARANTVHTRDSYLDPISIQDMGFGNETRPDLDTSKQCHNKINDPEKIKVLQHQQNF